MADRAVTTVTTVVTGRYSDDEHRTHVLVETEGRQVRFDVVDIPDGTYGYSRADRELVLPGSPTPVDPADRVNLWARPGSYRWLVQRLVDAGVADVEASRSRPTCVPSRPHPLSAARS